MWNKRQHCVWMAPEASGPRTLPLSRSVFSLSHCYTRPYTTLGYVNISLHSLLLPFLFRDKDFGLRKRKNFIEYHLGPEDSLVKEHFQLSIGETDAFADSPIDSRSCLKRKRSLKRAISVLPKLDFLRPTQVGGK